MLRWALCALAFVLVALNPGEAFAQLPTTSFVFDSNTCASPGSVPGKTGPQCRQPANFEIYIRDNTTGVVTKVTNDPNYDSWWPKLSPDRTLILFHRTDAGLKERDGFQRTSLWVVPVTGGTPKILMSAYKGIASTLPPGNFGYEMQAHAEWSPNGTQIALLVGDFSWPADRPLQIARSTYTPGANPTISAPQRVTFGLNGAPRPGTVLDPAWKATGEILFIGCPINPANAAECHPDIAHPTNPINASELFLTPNSTTDINGEVPITSHGTDTRQNFDPYYNTNNGQLAWLRQVNCGRWSIQHSLTNGTLKSEVIDDGATNSKPGWSGLNSMYFHRWANSIQSIPYAVNFFGGFSGWLDSGPLSELCQTEAPNSTSTRTGGAVVAPPNGLETTAMLMASSRCAPGSACNTAKNWRIYKRYNGVITNPTAGWPLANPPQNTGGDAFAPRISPDRSRILFMRTDGGMRGNPHAQELWVMNANGTGATLLLASGDGTNLFGWKTMSDANWSPDGTQIVISAATAAQLSAKRSQIYTMTFKGSAQCTGILGPGGVARNPPCVDNPVRRSFGTTGTTERDGNNIQPSWSTDTAAGTTLYFIGCALNPATNTCVSNRRSEIVMTAAGGTSSASSAEAIVTNSTISPNDGVAFQSPMIAPNGTNLIAVRTLTCSSTDIVMMPPVANATVTKLFGGAIHLSPQWLHDSTGITLGLIADDTRASIYTIAPNFPSPGTPDDGTPIPPTAVTVNVPCATEFPSTGY